MTVVRPAVARDAESFRRVLADSWRAGYRELLAKDEIEAVIARRDVERYRTMIVDPGTSRAGSWVVEAEGDVVGVAHFRETPDDDLGASHGEITLMYLLEEAWGTGAARSLLDAVLDDMRVVGFAAATLWVFSDNLRARRFYERAGFHLDGAESRRTYGDRDLPVVRYRLGL